MGSVESKWQGDYEYKGFVIWNAADKEWIAEPKEWGIKAIEKMKSEQPQLETITKAKKWVRDFGVKLNESDFL